MNRLRQPGDSHYDVLGVSPNASDDEINTAFRELIDGEGYKVGVPLNRQWLRARQIKDAHAALADPAMRQAYDDSLGQVPEASPWAMSAQDAATDALVMPEPEAPAPASTGLEPSPDGGLDVEGQLADADHPPADDPEPTSNDSEIIFAPAVDANRRGSARAWGAATAVASVLGLAILSTWPGSDRQSPAGAETSGLVAPDEQASAAGLGFAHQLLGTFNRAANPEPQDDPANASPAAPRAPEQPTGRQSASDEQTAQSTRELATNGAATGTTRAEEFSQPAEPIEARATAPASASQPVDAPATVAAAQPGGAETPNAIVRSPPQWVGGGPTDADNRRGRYQGSLTVQVNVEADGSVSKCAPVRGSGNAGLDEMTCRLVRERARFTPALDAQGRPVAAQSYTTFVWGRNRRR